MARISLDNGVHFLNADEAIEEMEKQERDYGTSVESQWEVIVNAMDIDTQYEVDREIAPCSMLEFLDRYLERANEDLIIG